METNEKLTAANIRYLLTMKAFADADRPIRNTYLAEHLHYKKSSVHAMLKFLESAGIIEKDADNIIRLTEKGEEVAVRYQGYFITVDSVMKQCFPGFEDRESAVLALLAEIPEETLQHLQPAD